MAKIYAAEGIGTRLTGTWYGREITPQGETGYVRQFQRKGAQPIGGGAVRPVSSLYTRQIGPQGAEGPLRPYGMGLAPIIDLSRMRPQIQQIGPVTQQRCRQRGGCGTQPVVSDAPNPPDIDDPRRHLRRWLGENVTTNRPAQEYLTCAISQAALLNVRGHRGQGWFPLVPVLGGIVGGAYGYSTHGASKEMAGWAAGGWLLAAAAPCVLAMIFVPG